MKKLIYTLLLSAGCIAVQAQSTAMDFSGLDCNGNQQHLFADLDADNAVILEFFMTNCSPCVTAGTALEAMKTDLLAQYPGRVKSYAFGFNNAYTCPTVANWVNTNGFSSIPMDSGSAQVAYYGGFGMPTIVILGGSAHSILGSPYIGFTMSDTTTMAADLRDFLSGATAITPQTMITDVQVHPQPANASLQMRLQLAQAGELQLTVVDLNGREVQAVFTGDVAAGLFEQTVDTRALAAGLYLLRIQQGDVLLHQRMMVAH
jgi:hypothetical protein